MLSLNAVRLGIAASALLSATAIPVSGVAQMYVAVAAKASGTKPISEAFVESGSRFVYVTVRDGSKNLRIKLRSDGVTTATKEFAVPKGYYSARLHAVNSSGAVVGSATKRSQLSTGQTDIVYWSPAGTATVLGTGWAAGINEAGQVLANVWTSSGQILGIWNSSNKQWSYRNSNGGVRISSNALVASEDGVSYPSGSLVRLPGFTECHGVSSLGAAVGWNGTHAQMATDIDGDLVPDTGSDIHPEGGMWYGGNEFPLSLAYDVNAAGVVAGTFGRPIESGDVVQEAARYRPGEGWSMLRDCVALSFSGSLLEAYGINSDGWIACRGQLSSGESMVYILIPTTG